MTLSDLNGRRYAFFHTIRHLSKPIASNSLKLDPHCQRQKCNPESLVMAIHGLRGRRARGVSAVAEVLVGLGAKGNEAWMAMQYLQ